jgi:hypothetical protein
MHGRRPLSTDAPEREPRAYSGLIYQTDRTVIKCRRRDRELVWLLAPGIHHGGQPQVVQTVNERGLSQGHHLPYPARLRADGRRPASAEPAMVTIMRVVSPGIAS